MNTKQITNENYDQIDRTYGAIEASLKFKGYKVLHLHRDVRGDWGDDGGFIWAVSYKDSKFYAHVIMVNYNIPVPDFYPANDTNEVNKEFDYVGDAMKYIRNLSAELERMCSETETIERDGEDVTLKERYSYLDGYYEDPDEIREEFTELAHKSDEELNAINMCIFAFSEYVDSNVKGFEKCLTERYVENFVKSGDNEQDDMYDNDYKFTV